MVQTVDIHGVAHAYELTPPTTQPCVLVFVHGWLLSREYWKPLIQKLSPDYQCLSYDMRGFGGSNQVSISDDEWLTAAMPSGFSRRSSPYTPLAYAHDLVALLDALNVEQAWLVGHSLGGSISLWASDLAPHRIKGVSCVNSGGGIYVKEEFEKFRMAGQQLIRFRPRWLCYLPLIDRLMTRMNVAQPVERQWGHQRVVDLVIAQAEAALGTLLDSTTEAEVHTLPQLVSRLKQPVYFISGADDDIMEPKYVNHLASFHPSFQCVGSNVMQIPDCGHMAMVEQPERVEDCLRKNLAAHGY